MAGSIVVAVLLPTLTGFAATAAAFAVNLVISAVISRVFTSTFSGGGSDFGGGGIEPIKDPGNRQQVAPATNNKLGVVYGSAYVGGTVVDLSISSNNLDIYYVIALSEVAGGGTDTYNIGNIYWAGKRVTLSGSEVTSLTDESNNAVDTSVAGKFDIFLYRNGSNQPINTSRTAIDVMSNSDLIYRWDSTKLMTNCVFAIVHLRYSVKANLRGLEQTRFQVINTSRFNPGACIQDYLTSTVYGAGIPLANVDTASLAALDTYSSQVITYQNFDGSFATQPRFRLDGVVDPTVSVMDNLQTMTLCCDSLLRYNEVTGLWGVVTQQPTYTVATTLSDSNIVSAFTISSLDLSSSFNEIEVKFADNTAKDTFANATFDLSQINPDLLNPGEPVNRQSFTLSLVNDNVRAQLIANRLLEAARVDLQVQCDVNYQGLQLEAGDICYLVSTIYGWNAPGKLFRVQRVNENFADDGTVTASLNLMEFNPQVYDDANITKFKPTPTLGIPAPDSWGIIPAPAVVSQFPTDATPSFNVQATTSASGITEYAEIWYSAFQNPQLDSQRFFLGTTSVLPSGNSYPTNTAMPAINVSTLAYGDWYFFTRFVNSLKTSAFSAASLVFKWRPQTISLPLRYALIAYADSDTGTNFNLVPTSRTYFGVYNSDTTTPSTQASDYKWFLADPAFGTNNVMLYRTFGSRRVQLDTGTAGSAGGSGGFVPTEPNFDPSIWSALPLISNTIDLDASSGQVLSTGTTGIGNGQLNVATNPNSFLSGLASNIDLGAGVGIQTTTPSTITYDNFGRILGFDTPDRFVILPQFFNANAGQTVFTVTRPNTYILGQSMVFFNGALLAETEYTDATISATQGTVTLTNPAAAGDRVGIVPIVAISQSDTLEGLSITVATVTGASLTYNFSPLQFINVGDQLRIGNSLTNWIVQSVNFTTRTITFTATLSGINANDLMFRRRPASTAYPPFTRLSGDLVDVVVINSPFFNFDGVNEMVFVNGVFQSAQDYDFSNGNYVFPNPITGNVSIFQWAKTNLSQPAGNQSAVSIYSTTGQTRYLANVNPISALLYASGLILVNGVDYGIFNGSFNLTAAFPNNTTLITQQTFANFI